MGDKPGQLDTGTGARIASSRLCGHWDNATCDAGTDAGTVICGLIRGMCVTPGRQAGTARCCPGLSPTHYTHPCDQPTINCPGFPARFSATPSHSPMPNPSPTPNPSPNPESAILFLSEASGDHLSSGRHPNWVTDDSSTVNLARKNNNL